MNDYTERLKKYWHSKDLTFVAYLNKINDKQGRFERFINPTNGRRIFYPEFDELQIEDKQVSFFFANAHDLNHGEHCKVRLGFTNEPGSINNPYSLEILEVDPLNQNEIQAKLNLIKGMRQQNDTIYIGRYHRVSDAFCVFENVMENETGDIFMQYGEAQKVYVSPREELTDNNHYSFRIQENLGQLPNAIPGSIKELNVNPYQDYIRLRFERLNNPEANKMIANLMREIGKGMYSSKQRMIFELLQNADDAPGKEKVEFHIDINEDYFFVMHDGIPFNKDDVEAITSAAESTKRNSTKKTGYKGIGFKSVFTDSTEVWLKSGGYQFAFLRNSEVFEDFDKFYFSSERYKKYPELLKEDREKYRNQRLKFNGSTDIPWQVIPIWQDQLPEEFNDSNFDNFNNPVQFGLRLGRKNIDQYLVAIDNIAKRPQFILFLRNTSKFRSPKNGVTISRDDKENEIKIIESRKGESNRYYNYLKESIDNIEVSDSAFYRNGIGLRKESKVNDYNEVSYFFTDLEGREIETIPPKLASVSKTEISLGISIQDSKVCAEKDYLNGLPKFSSLFTYLPMEDTRFKLPFHVNADFVPSADRQKIQGDNLWNRYVMIQVAKKHVETLEKYAKEFITDKDFYSKYLSLLLKEPIPTDDTAQQIIDSYNEKYLNCLENAAVIANDLGETQRLSDTILDNSGITKIFGHELFYEITGTEKKLPDKALNDEFLKNYSYLKVESVNIEELAINLNLNPDLCERMGEVIEEKELYNNPELLEWLDRLVVNTTKGLFGKIPFIVHNRSLFSIEKLLNESDAWLLNNHTYGHQDLLEELGYHVVNLQLDRFPNIQNFLQGADGYINDKSLAYERLSSNSNLSKLSIKKKVKLLEFFQSSDFMRGIGESKYFGEIRLFIDEKGKAHPLWQLISRDSTIEVNSILSYRMDEAEFVGLPEDLQKNLISKDKIFTSFILKRDLFDDWSKQFNAENIEEYVLDLKTIYSWKEANEEILQSSWTEIPWIFIDETIKFVHSEKVYWSQGFNHLTDEQYETVKTILHSTCETTLPLRTCGELVDFFDLHTLKEPVDDWSVLSPVDTFHANILLDWMEVDGGFSDFFDSYSFNQLEDEKWSIYRINETHVFDGSNPDLTEYIRNKDELQSYYLELNPALCSETRAKIGVLKGDELLHTIIRTGGYDQELASFLPFNPSWKEFARFITNLPELNLNTNMDFSSNSPEHIIFNFILKYVEEPDSISEPIQDMVDQIRSKITIDGSKLDSFNLSDRIQFGKGESKKNLKLSDVIEEYKGESDVLDKLIEAFVSIGQKAKLRKVIFKTRFMPFNDICDAIDQELTPYYSIYQVVFQLLYNQHVGQRTTKKKRFDTYWNDEENFTALNQSYKQFLGLLFELDYSDLQYFEFVDTQIENCVDKNWALQSELIPTWLEEWIGGDGTKFTFISKLGYNGDLSSIVKLRKTASANEPKFNTQITYLEQSKVNTRLIWNTIEWLSKYSSDIITRNIQLISEITGLSLENYLAEKTIFFPCIASVSSHGERTYTIIGSTEEQSLLFLSVNQDDSFDIYRMLKNNNHQEILVDESIGALSKRLNSEEIKVAESIDVENLIKDSVLWSDLFYRKWEHATQYPIYIFNGEEIPYKRTWNGFLINSFSKDMRVCIDGKYFVSYRLRNDVLNNLPENFPSDILTNLRNWHYKTLQNESLLDEDSFEYKENIDRLLQDRLGISEEEQKKESGNAKTHAIYFLDEEGYDITHIENSGAMLSNIFTPSGDNVNCVVRGAKGGLLYLDKHHWDMLGDVSTYLVVIYPGNSPRLFKDRLELLNEELAENVLFRIPNSRETSEVDGVFKTLDSESHLILVTSEKMKKSLFSKKKTKGSFAKEDDSAVGDDNFRL